jgi:single-strand DNA-binding protein
MNMLNSIILEGVVEKDATSKMLGGITVATMPISVKRKYKNSDGSESEETSLFDVETYGNIAVSVNKYAKKGQGIRVVGRLKQKRWEEDGKTMSKVVVIAEHVEYKFSPAKKEEDKSDN